MRGSDTKERIERAALELFVARGIAETSIREIAKAAGVALGALYNHYPSKDDLAWELFERHFARLGEDLRDRGTAGSDLATRLRAMVAYVFAEFDADRVLVSYVFLARHQQLPKMRGGQANPFVVFRTVIAEAMARGEIPRRDVDLMTALVVGAINQVVDSTILGRIRRELASHAGEVSAGCLRMLQG